MNVHEVVKHNNCFRATSNVTSVSIVSVASVFFGFADVLEYTFLTRNEVDAFICFTAGVKVHCMFDAGAYLEELWVGIQVVECTEFARSTSIIVAVLNWGNHSVTIT